ncbi:hypothetical protein TNIN_187811 [Trichonephila inaurata madagascariensis]|uniref:Uncharacterized protein n=1 Tax=Trichonephila inaurata madagascariensis TaxID=2747483 RepID=A0A8X7C324_9ARAC|nr:hypothetical protein TNIN_187811 [Trichonephila inaurata madagascariensis]
MWSKNTSALAQDTLSLSSYITDAVGSDTKVDLLTAKVLEKNKKVALIGTFRITFHPDSYNCPVAMNMDRNHCQTDIAQGRSGPDQLQKHTFVRKD